MRKGRYVGLEGDVRDVRGREDISSLSTKNSFAISDTLGPSTALLWRIFARLVKIEMMAEEIKVKDEETDGNAERVRL